MTKTQKPPKYFGKYRNKRDLLYAVRAKSEADPNSHFFDRSTIRFFGAYKHTIEVVNGVVAICSHCRVPKFGSNGYTERFSYHRINEDLTIGSTL